MRLLLDTHAAVWSASDSRRLPREVSDLIADPGNQVFVSSVSIWEIAIKARSKAPDRFPFTAGEAQFIFERLGYRSLEVSWQHAAAVEDLPLIHRDPFDRLLVAQSLSEPLRLITHDRALVAYSDTIIVF